MNKIVVINGPATSGKNTFIRTVRTLTYTPVYSFSSIYPIKEALFKADLWDGKHKDKNARNLMIQKKAEMINNGDLPLKYLIKKIKTVSNGLIFIHIRENSEIKKFIEKCELEFKITPITSL